jgi:phage-related protein
LGVTASQLVGKVTIQGVSQAKSDLQTVGSDTDTLRDKLKNSLSGALAFASNVAGQALGFLKDQLVDSVKVAMDHQAVMSQTAQVLKSTHDASGMTAQSLDDLSHSLANTTTFSDDTIESGENLLLTFTGIGKDVFPQVTSTMLDMSQAMGMDTKSAALQLGKALNDPLTGMTALTREGVTFSDAEKKSIQTMMAHNDVAGAQKVMLKELQTEFGGSAKAAGQTFGGQVAILQNHLEELKEKIGTALLPILSSLMSVVSNEVMPALDRFSAWFSSTVGPALQRFGDFLNANVVPALKSMASNANSMIPVLAGLGAIIASILVPATIMWAAGVVAATWPFLAIGVAVAALTAIFMAFYNNNKPFRDFINAIGSAIASLAPIFQQIGAQLMSNLMPAWKQLQQAFQQALPALQMIGTILGVVLLAAIGVFIGAIVGWAKAISAVIVGVVGIFTGFVEIFTGIFNILAGIVSVFVDLFTGNWSKLGSDLKQIWTGITQMFMGEWQIITSIFQMGVGVITGLVGGFVQGIVSFFQGMFDSLVGHSIIPDMINGIVSWFAQLPGRAMGYISSLVSQISGALGGLGSQALAWAGDMISNFVAGIQNGIAAVGNAAANIASAISSHLHFSLPEVGPLAQADQWMPDFTSMLADGMNSGLGKIKGASLNVAASISGPVSGSVGAGIVPSSVTQSQGAPQIIVQPAPIYLDGRLLASALMPYVTSAIKYSTGYHNG